MPIVATLVMLAAATQGATQEPVRDAPDWKRLRMTVKAPVSAVPDETHEVIYTTDAEQPGTALFCGGGKLRVRFGTAPNPMRDVLGEARVRARRDMGRFYVDAERATEGEWRYFPTFGAAEAGDRPTAAKTFNAAVRRQTVSFDIGDGEVTPHLPPPDENFRAWIEACEANGTL